MPSKELEALMEERFKVLRPIVAEHDGSIVSLTSKVKDLPCFKGIDLGGIRSFLYKNKDKFGGSLVRDRHVSRSQKIAREKPANTGITAQAIDLSKFDGILSRFTQKLSYQDGNIFRDLVESHLRPYVRALAEEAARIQDLETKIADLNREIAEIRDHRCPDANADAAHEINHLQRQIEALETERHRLVQRNEVLSNDNQSLRNRLQNSRNHLAVHASSVRTGSDG